MQKWINESTSHLTNKQNNIQLKSKQRRVEYVSYGSYFVYNGSVEE